MAKSSEIMSEKVLSDWCRTTMVLLVLAMWCTTISAQHSEAQLSSTRARCISFDFESEVDDYLSYTVPVISVADAAYDAPEYIFLDSRAQEEYAVSHIPGARHVGYADFDLSSISDIPRDSPIIVYCSIGYRSEKIGEKLQNAGFSKVYNLYGSIFEWVNQGYPINDPSGHVTDRLHVYSERWGQWCIAPAIIKVH